MRRRKKASVQHSFRRKRRGNDMLYSVGLLDSTIRDLYAFIVLGHNPVKMRSIRKQMIAKNRHPGRKDKYKKKFSEPWE